MRTLIASAIIIAGTTFSGASFAEDQIVNGTVKTYDAQTRVVMLENGNSFKLGKKTPAENVKEGETVALTVIVNKNGNKVVSDVKTAN